MSLTVQKAGILTTVQDIGRTGFKKAGINPNGAMDKSSVRILNILLSNDENAAVVEMHFPAPVFMFQKAALIAIGGGDFSPKIDGSRVENWKMIRVKKDQTLSFLKKLSGNRGYLAVAGGFKVEKWLESASTNLQAKIGGFEGRKLEVNDQIGFQKASIKASPSIAVSQHFASYLQDSLAIRIIAGAEFDSLTGLSEEFLFNEEFTVSNNSDRMGFRLKGKPLHLLSKIELVSSAVDFGTIQLLPDGQMIILMADHQTTGGYPRIAHVVSADLPKIAQLGANDSVKFELVSLKKAEELIEKIERDLRFLKIGCEFAQMN